MTKGSSRLSRLGVLAPVALSACMDASVLAVPAAGVMVSTVLKELSKAFMLKKWFHGTMSSEEAEELLMENGKHGSFLVRESQSYPGDYVLSVKVRRKVKHIMIKKENNKYDVGSGEYFDDMVELIEHLRTYPMIMTCGDIIRLMQPVNGTKHKKPDIIRKLSNIKISESISHLIDSKAIKEFDELKHNQLNTSCSSTEASLPKNAIKNRYQNILPYDHNRVILKPLNNTDSSDYINASHIYHSFLPASLYANHSANGDVALKKLCDTKSYIATQGCMPNTIYDFWLMIWQQDVRIVAAIGLPNENGKKKYETYWPEQLGVEQRFENFIVTMLSQNSNKHYIVREFQICDGHDPKRTIFQYQITSWPDHDVPDEPCGVLMLVQDINNKLLEFANSDDPPIKNIVCVHCSAGVGRTGTFIALDILLTEARMFGDAELSVIDAVKAIRAQRRGMVQTKAQYKFLYKALKRYFS